MRLLTFFSHAVLSTALLGGMVAGDHDVTHSLVSGRHAHGNQGAHLLSRRGPSLCRGLCNRDKGGLFLGTGPDDGPEIRDLFKRALDPLPANVDRFMVDQFRSTAPIKLDQIVPTAKGTTSVFRVIRGVNEKIHIGAEGLCGCTVLAIVSPEAVYMAHFFEDEGINPPAIDPATKQPLDPEVEYQKYVTDFLDREVTVDADSKPPKRFPGLRTNVAAFGDKSKVKAFIMTPRKEEKAAGDTADDTNGQVDYLDGLNYEPQVEKLINIVKGYLGADNQPTVYAYQALDYDKDQMAGGDKLLTETARGHALFQYGGRRFREGSGDVRARLLFESDTVIERGVGQALQGVIWQDPPPPPPTEDVEMVDAKRRRQTAEEPHGNEEVVIGAETLTLPAAGHTLTSTLTRSERTTVVLKPTEIIVGQALTITKPVPLTRPTAVIASGVTATFQPIASSTTSSGRATWPSSRTSTSSSASGTSTRGSASSGTTSSVSSRTSSPSPGQFSSGSSSRSSSSSETSRGSTASSVSSSRSSSPTSGFATSSRSASSSGFSSQATRSSSGTISTDSSHAPSGSNSASSGSSSHGSPSSASLPSSTSTTTQAPRTTSSGVVSSTGNPFPSGVFTLPPLVTTTVVTNGGTVTVTGTANSGGIIVPVQTLQSVDATRSASAIVAEMSGVREAVLAYSANTADPALATAATNAIREAEDDTNNFGTGLGIAAVGLCLIFCPVAAGVAASLGTLSTAVSGVVAGTAPVAAIGGAVAGLDAATDLLDNALEQSNDPNDPDDPDDDDDDDDDDNSSSTSRQQSSQQSSTASSWQTTSMSTTSATTTSCSGTMVTHTRLECATGVVNGGSATSSCRTISTVVTAACGASATATTSLAGGFCPLRRARAGPMSVWSYPGFTFQPINTGTVSESSSGSSGSVSRTSSSGSSATVSSTVSASGSTRTTLATTTRGSSSSGSSSSVSETSRSVSSTSARSTSSAPGGLSSRTSLSTVTTTSLATSTRRIRTVTNSGMICTLIEGSNHPVCRPETTPTPNPAGTNVHVKSGCILINNSPRCAADAGEISQIHQSFYNVAPPPANDPYGTILILSGFPTDKKNTLTERATCQLQARWPGNYGDVYFQDGCLYDSNKNKIYDQCCSAPDTNNRGPTTNPYAAPAPPAPAQTSGNHDGSSICASVGKNSYVSATKRFMDNVVYHEYTSAVWPDSSGADIVESLHPLGEIFVDFFGINYGATAIFRCDNDEAYKKGMTGKQIKDAVTFHYANNGAKGCGSTYLNNGCHITLNGCNNCRDAGASGTLWHPRAVHNDSYADANDGFNG